MKVSYRAFVVRKVQWDDAAVTCGALLTVAMTGVLVSVFNDAGLKHSALVSPVVVGAPQFVDVRTLLLDISPGNTISRKL